MPKVLQMFLGYIIYFWIGDGDEPIHVHISKKEQTKDATKIWITSDGIEVAHNKSNIPEHDMKRLIKYLKKNRYNIIAEWTIRFGHGEVKR